MTDAPPGSKRAQIHGESGDPGDGETWQTFALGGAIVYALGCCLVLPFAFGSWAAFTAAAVFGAPVWLLLLLGGIGIASLAVYVGTNA